MPSSVLCSEFYVEAYDLKLIPIFNIALTFDGLGGGATITTYVNFILEWFSIQFRKTKNKPINYKLDYSANLKP